MKRTLRDGSTVDDLLEGWDEHSIPAGPSIDFDPLTGHLQETKLTDDTAVDIAIKLMDLSESMAHAQQDFGSDDEGEFFSENLASQSGKLKTWTKKHLKLLQGLDKLLK